VYGRCFAISAYSDRKAYISTFPVVPSSVKRMMSGLSEVTNEVSRHLRSVIWKHFASLRKSKLNLHESDESQNPETVTGCVYEVINQ
jgi:hypothetical protein